MISFTIEWTNKQKFLEVITGVLKITDQNTYIDPKSGKYTMYYRELGQCQVVVQRGSISFTQEDTSKGIPALVLELINDELKNSLYSYYGGFLLKDRVYNSINFNDGEDTLKWAKRKIKNMSKYQKFTLFQKKTPKEINEILEKLFKYRESEIDDSRQSSRKIRDSKKFGKH